MMDVKIEHLTFGPDVEDRGHLETVAETSTKDIAKSIARDRQNCHAVTAALLADLSNIGIGGSATGESVGKALHTEHRYLQSEVMQFCLGVIVGMSEQTRWDPRNRWAILKGKQIAAVRHDAIDGGEYGE